MDDTGILGHLVQAARIRVEERGHLVDEGTRTTGARTVHALLDAVVEVDDLGVLTTELDDHIGLRDEGLDGRLGGDDLLDELEVEPGGEQQTAGAGDGYAHGDVTELLEAFREELAHGGAYVGVMTAIAGVDDLVLLVQDRQLDGGRPYVDSELVRA